MKVQIIINRGYPAAIYQVTTEDLYILELHRIPYGRKKSKQTPGKPVLLVHPFGGSSSSYVISETNRSLGKSWICRFIKWFIINWLFFRSAFKLADRGYDVWIANLRGNIYSRKHKSLDINSTAYWSFSCVFITLKRSKLANLLQFIFSIIGGMKWAAVICLR